MLTAENIHKTYGSLPVLRGVDLSVQDGEIVSITGSSGAGKSTLLHILGTLDYPDQGVVRIKNTVISDLSGKALAQFRNQQIGFVFQFHNLLPEFSAHENVCLPGYIGKRNEEAVEARADELLKLLGVGKRRDHKPSELSGGEQQRVAVARALINEPALILADEPSGNLDAKNAQELHELFFQLRQDFGQTFVIVTHNIELADMADRRIELSQGRLLTSGKTHEG